MKKTALIALMVTALMLGTIGYAFANTKAENVTVTAKVPAAFSMTISTNAIDFTGAAFGAITNGSAGITVKSNKDWDFSKSQAVPAALTGYLTESTSDAPGTYGRGVRNITASYALNLTGDAAYDLEAGDYTATYGYTAVQK